MRTTNLLSRVGRESDLFEEAWSNNSKEIVEAKRVVNAVLESSIVGGDL